VRRLVKDSQDMFWTIGGILQSDKPLDKVQITLVEQGWDIPLQPEGRFAVGNLKAGEYTLEISREGDRPRRHKVTVPSADYIFEV
jgi:hypothetical protein